MERHKVNTKTGMATSSVRTETGMKAAFLETRVTKQSPCSRIASWRSCETSLWTQIIRDKITLSGQIGAFARTGVAVSGAPPDLGHKIMLSDNNAVCSASCPVTGKFFVVNRSIVWRSAQLLPHPQLYKLNSVVIKFFSQEILWASMSYDSLDELRVFCYQTKVAF